MKDEKKDKIIYVPKGNATRTMLAQWPRWRRIQIRKVLFDTERTAELKDKESIMLSDGKKYTPKEIYRHFIGERSCSEYRKKMKLFLIDACRGEECARRLKNRWHHRFISMIISWYSTAMPIAICFIIAIQAVFVSVFVNCEFPTDSIHHKNSWISWNRSRVESVQIAIQEIQESSARKILWKFAVRIGTEFGMVSESISEWTQWE